ncbi:DNA polymerase III subunit delta' [Rhodospirillaceae bacterium SYSU D60014]|uniref:DNA polymerase III subunit delta' n=1 Tax=Virgifigura deserti TaxID=2268457 RepID=UPI000E66518E
MSEAGSTPDVPEPRANPVLLGQEPAETALLQVWRSERMPHAWLLTGPRGIGKATLAYRFARLVLADGGLFGAGGDLQLDPQDPVFRRVASGGHPDLLTAERSIDDKGRLRTRITVEDVRKIGSFLRLTPAEGGWRVVIVDCADEMNPSAANALLKILEEPPKNALLLLVSHAPGGLLPTIRSRCRRLPLRPLPDPTVVELLGRYRPDLADQDRTVLAGLAEGSIGRAVDLAAEGGIDLYREVAGLLLSLPNLEGTRLHGLGDRFAKQGGETAFRTATDLLGRWFGRMICAGASGAPAAEILPGEAACMQQLLERRSLDQWLDLWEKMARLFAAVEDVNLDRKQAWVGTFLEIEGLARS